MKYLINILSELMLLGHEICTLNECSMDILIEALKNNVVKEVLRNEIKYLKSKNLRDK